ncbi:hypothetical protein P4H71_28250 [Paenibacillus kribbensis]|uniref:hypothetical protein n=1 Tax=Paenibacillus kribbensis TaxID=172713 RepID=UPI002DB64D84|nr:hypothetical protein [Paenibacillus kribbensis]MEC0238210.1 hypothetical protein [Paenibacillus kribbensis]
MDKFYRELSDSKLRAAYETIKKNIEQDILAEGMQTEKKLILGVATERGIDLEDISITSKLDTVRGYIEWSEVPK